MVSIKYYKPGNTVTLFERGIDNSFTGSLIIKRSDPLFNLQKSLMKALAVLLLFISIFSITTTTLPVMDGVLRIANFTNEHKSAKKDPNLISGNFILANEQDKSNEFVINIPKIDVVSDVIPNVD